MMLLPLDNPVIQDLLAAVQDEELSDISLIGHDNIPVPANRFVLAARSKVLKRMLYGNFKEAQSSVISLMDYNSTTLEAIVEYCCRNEISKFRVRLHRNASSSRRLVQLFKAADYLELPGLAKMVAQMAHNLTSRYPPLACAVFDEADLDTPMSNDALLMIQYRPYVTLPPDDDTEGGIVCLSADRLLAILQDPEVKAGELFLFEMLQQWTELAHHPNSLSVAQACAAFLSLEYIEPHDLLHTVKDSGFCTQERITEAITKQALRASKQGLWSLSSRGVNRGRPDVERILVEGAGSKEANGMYFRIDGLANGELYSKREVACGQQYVYTISCSLSDAKDQIECRLFCSKLLTHMAVKSLIQKPMEAFQPLLQVIKVEEKDPLDSCERETSPTRAGKKCTQVMVMKRGFGREDVEPPYVQDIITSSPTGCFGIA